MMTLREFRFECDRAYFYHLLNEKKASIPEIIKLSGTSNASVYRLLKNFATTPSNNNFDEDTFLDIKFPNKLEGPIPAPVLKQAQNRRLTKKGIAYQPFNRVQRDDLDDGKIFYRLRDGVAAEIVTVDFRRECLTYMVGHRYYQNSINNFILAYGKNNCESMKAMLQKV